MNFDIIVVGGGLVGASLVCALKNQNLKIALIDKLIPPAHPKQDLDARALALSLTSIQCLKMIDVLSKIEKELSPISEIQVSKQGYFGITHIKAKEYALPALGYVVNADVLNQALNQTVANLSPVEIFRPDEISELKKIENTWQVVLSTKKILTTKLLVAADGTESTLRKHQGIGIRIQDHNQTAFVVNLELEQSHHQVAYERFTSTGSIALLPFGRNEAFVKCIWIVPRSEVSYIEALSQSEFLENIQKNFGYQLGYFTKLGKRYVYPLKSIASDSLYSDHFVLIGNAANTLTPIAAQGFNMGLRDAAMLAEIIVSAKQHNQDIGSIESLQAYAASRQNDHHSIRQLCDRLAEPHLTQWLGILASEWVPPFKRFIVEWGSGKQQTLPKLCRGVSLTTL